MDEYMSIAVDEAKISLREGGIPIGAVLIKDSEIIGKGHNKRVQLDDPVMHAEIDCLQDAGRIGSYSDTVLYSTLMPCYLCSGAVIQFGIEKVVAGESRTFSGAADLLKSKGVEVVDLDLDECKMMMKDFTERNEELWNEDIGNL